MGIEIKWSEDGKFATISKEDLEKLQKNFNNGYAKGQESGRKEIMKLFSFLELDEENFEKGIGEIKQKLIDLKNGKLPKEITDKLKTSEDVIKDLQTKLEEKTNAFDALKQNFDSFKRNTLIDSKLTELAQKAKAIDAREAANLFKLNYQIEIGQDDKLIVKNQNGNVMFTETGDELGLYQVFERFSKEKSYLFQAEGSGGSGGGDGGPGQGLKVSEMKQEDFEKTVSDVMLGKQVKLE